MCKVRGQREGIYSYSPVRCSVVSRFPLFDAIEKESAVHPSWCTPRRPMCSQRSVPWSGPGRERRSAERNVHGREHVSGAEKTDAISLGNYVSVTDHLEAKIELDRLEKLRLVGLYGQGDQRGGLEGELEGHHGFSAGPHQQARGRGDQLALVRRKCPNTCQNVWSH